MQSFPAKFSMPSSSRFPWLGQEAPRYTSYPSAHHFSGQVGPEAYANWLKAIAPGSRISTYVHIPFCREICWFCGCHTKATQRYEPVREYLGDVLREIAMIGRLVGQNAKVANLHFGGGSPSVLQDRDLGQIIQAIDAAFGGLDLNELAIELDPRTVTRGKIAAYGSLGVTRASLGVQDFTPMVQRAIGRIQPFKMVAEVAAGLRAKGVKHLNIDLMYGLPLQTVESILASVEKTLSLSPDRVSLFSYAHMPSLKKHQRLINETQLPNDVAKLELNRAASRRLIEAGYVAIGMDHFVKPEDSMAVALREGALRRNFQGYVTDQAETLIGFGASAIGQFAQGYAQNTAVTGDYHKIVADGHLPVVRGWRFDPEDKLRKAVIDSLMCFMRVDLDDIAGRFAVPPTHFADAMKDIDRLQDLGVARREGNVIEVISEHRMTARLVAAVFDQYLHQGSSRYSKVA